MYSSEYWSTTNRRIREVFPTPPSPRRTILAFIDSEAICVRHLRCPFIKRSVPFSWTKYCTNRDARISTLRSD